MRCAVGMHCEKVGMMLIHIVLVPTIMRFGMV